MCRQSRSMLARDGKNIVFTMPAPRLDLFSFGQNGRGRILRGVRELMAARVGGIWAGVAGLMLRRCLCVEGWAFRKRVSKLIPIRAILRVKARV